MILSLFIATSIIITEVQIVNNNHIELYNDSAKEIDISGYRLKKKSSTGKEYSVRVFPKGTIIGAHDSFIWANSEEDYHIEIGADLWSTTKLANNNSIALLSPEGAIIDAVAWGRGEAQFGFGKPIIFDNKKNLSIKRVFNELGFSKTQDNANDFRVEPGVLNNSHSVEIGEIREIGIRSKKSSPVLIGGVVSLLASLLVIIIKRYGWS